jgi:hypothetical protein
MHDCLNAEIRAVLSVAAAVLDVEHHYGSIASDLLLVAR